MMIPLKRNISAFLSFALLAMFVASCSQPTGPVASGSKSFGVNTPPDHSSSNFNLARPTLSGGQSGAGTISLSWTNGRTVGSEAAGGEFYPATGTWNNPGVVFVKPGSGHTEILMWNETTSTWDSAGQEIDGNWSGAGFADGTYWFYVKEKSKLDATGSETETFHSNPSNVLEVEVVSCVNEWTLRDSSISGGSGANISGYSLSIKKGSNVNNSKFNFHFKLRSSCGLELVGRTVRVRVNRAEDPLNPNDWTPAWVNHTDGDINDINNLPDGTYPVNGIDYGIVGATGPHPILIEIYNPDSDAWEAVDYTTQPWSITVTN